jgi:hypothetical protein
VFLLKLNKHIIIDVKMLKNTATRVTKLSLRAKIGKSAEMSFCFTAVRISAISMPMTVIAITLAPSFFCFEYCLALKKTAASWQVFKAA